MDPLRLVLIAFGNDLDHSELATASPFSFSNVVYLNDLVPREF